MEKILYSLPSTHQSVPTSLRLPTRTSLPPSVVPFFCLPTLFSFLSFRPRLSVLPFLPPSLTPFLHPLFLLPPLPLFSPSVPFSIDPFLIYLSISPLTLSFLSTFYPSSLPSIFVYLLIQLWICFICSFREIKDPKERKVKLVYLARKATKDGRDLRERLDLMAHR